MSTPKNPFYAPLPVTIVDSVTGVGVNIDSTGSLYTVDPINITTVNTGELSATTQVTVVAGILVYLDLLSPATGVSTIKIYDTAVGSLAAKIIFEASTSAGFNSISLDTHPRPYVNGLYAVLSGSATTFIIGHT